MVHGITVDRIDMLYIVDTLDIKHFRYEITLEVYPVSLKTVKMVLDEDYECVIKDAELFTEFNHITGAVGSPVNVNFQSGDELLVVNKDSTGKMKYWLISSR